LSTLLCILLPQLPLVIALTKLPTEISGDWIVDNGMVIAAATTIISMLAGPLITSLVTLLCYFCLAIIDNLIPWTRPFLPIAAYPGTDSSVTYALVLVVGAVVVAVATGGTSAWAHRLSHNEG
jgi:uncharacterized membrane protein (DUF485 family)